MPKFSSHLKVLPGGANDPLRDGVCRRAGCAETAVELGLCTDCFQGYNRVQGQRERALALHAAANFDTLMSAAANDLDLATDPEADREWLWALGEHLAAHGLDPHTAMDEYQLRKAVLDAISDYAGEAPRRAHLQLVG